MFKTNLKKTFLCVMAAGLMVPMAVHAQAEQTKLVAWEFDTTNNQYTDGPINATTGTGELTFYAEDGYTVTEEDDRVYGNVMFTAPALDKDLTFTAEDWVDASKHAEYIQFSFSMTGYTNPQISFGLAADSGTKWRMVYSTDGGTSWSDGGEFTTDQHWGTACSFGPVGFSATDKEQVLVRILNVQNGTKNSFDTRIKTFVVMAEEYSLPSFSNETVTATWPMTAGADCPSAAEVSAEGAFTITSFTVGEGLGFNRTRTDDNGAVYTTYTPTEQVSAPTEEHTLRYAVTPAAGLTFTPTNVSFNTAKWGTSKGYVDAKLVYADGTEIVIAEKIEPQRLNDPGVGTAINQDLVAAAATTGTVVLELSIYNINKELGFNNVVITGTVDGQVEAVPTYTFATSLTPEGAGTVMQNPTGNEFDQGTQITLTATPNFGYDFVRWVNGEGEELSTEESFKLTLEENTTVTAEFVQVNTYELSLLVEGGANDYMVAASPEGTMVDGKRMYEEGTQVTVTASNNPILTFTGWSNGQTEPTQTVMMNGDQSLTASYSAADYIVAWDFYREGGNNRPADFISSVDNETTTLILRNAAGATEGWLDKSQLAAGGYEGRPAAVNWRTVFGQEDRRFYWQTMINARDFKDIQVASAMLINYNSYSVQKLEYSLDGEEFKEVARITISGSKVWTDLNGTLPAEANNQEKVYIRWIPDYTSDVIGTSSDNDGIALGAIWITGTPEIPDDGVPPVLEKSVPEEGATGASATGSIVLTFNERVQIAEGTTATLNDKTLEPKVTGTSITFSYMGLDYNTAYTFTLPGNTVSDLAGNTMTDDIVLHFTTMAPPVVTKGLYDAVVSNVDELLAAIEEGNDIETGRYRIFVKNGTYDLGTACLTPIGSNISLIGESMEGTLIVNRTPEKEDGTLEEGIGTTATFLLTGDNIYMQDLTLQNAYPYGQPGIAGRAVVIQDKGNKNVFKNVKMLSYQDTYYTNNATMRSYLEDCEIHGVVDFICGSGDIFFNRALLYVEARDGNGGHITAPSTSTDWGYVFSNCTIDGPESQDGQFNLGRPWQGSPRCVWLNTTMNIQPTAAGWADMGVLPALFAEYNSHTANGTPVNCDNRKMEFKVNDVMTPVEYPSAVLTEEEAAEYTIANVLGGNDAWQPNMLTEQAAAPAIGIDADGTTLTWEANDYVRCWAICQNGVVVDFTTENSYAIPAETLEGVAFTVRAANDMGGLGAASNVYEYGNPDSIRDAAAESGLDIFAAGNEVRVEGIAAAATIYVFNTSGMLVDTIETNEDVAFALPAGAYIVKAVTEGESKSNVVMVR